jgi:dienelactone hydrolase
MTPRGLIAAAATTVRDAGDLRRGPAPRDVSIELDGDSCEAAIFATDEPRPGALLLHTATGLTVHERAMALRLHLEGLACLFVSYSAKTTGRVVDDEAACRRIDRVVTAAFDRLRSDPGVDPGRAGLFGLSLGGYFALRFAARSDAAAPAAIAVWYGMYPSAVPMVGRIRSPLLLVQGSDDAATFVAGAQEAASFDPERVELLFLEGAAHQFDLFQSRSPATREAWDRTVAFLKGIE